MIRNRWIKKKDIKKINHLEKELFKNIKIIFKNQISCGVAKLIRE